MILFYLFIFAVSDLMEQSSNNSTSGNFEGSPPFAAYEISNIWDTLSEMYSRCLIILHLFLGLSRTPFANIPGKEKSEWRIPSGIDGYHPSIDASLFSRSLPFLPINKCKHEWLSFFASSCYLEFFLDLVLFMCSNF